MVTTSEALIDDTLATPSRRARRSERLFFSGISIALLLTVFVGFAPTYFLRESFGSPALTPSLQVHGLLFTTWMVLLVVQTGRRQRGSRSSPGSWHDLNPTGSRLDVDGQLIQSARHGSQLAPRF